MLINGLIADSKILISDLLINTFTYFFNEHTYFWWYISYLYFQTLLNLNSKHYTNFYFTLLDWTDERSIKHATNEKHDTSYMTAHAREHVV